MQNLCRLVSYLRVSTDKQGRSGLGLEAQEAAVTAHVAATGCSLVGSYTEVETGKRDSLDNRPELRRAIAHAKRAKATLVVAKLDRLTRSVAVTSMLHTSGVEFIACDNPGANRMTIQILAVVAENEARMISDRTKAALAAYKARGGQLGASLDRCRNLTPQARERGSAAAAKARRRNAVLAYADVAPFIAELRKSGLSLRAIAYRLDSEGYATRAERRWNAMLVSRILASA